MLKTVLECHPEMFYKAFGPLNPIVPDLTLKYVPNAKAF